MDRSCTVLYDEHILEIDNFSDVVSFFCKNSYKYSLATFWTVRLNVGIEFEIRLLATMSEQFDSGMHKFHNFTETVFIIQRGKNCFVALLPTENLIKQMDFYGNYIVTIVLWRFYADYHCRERSHTQTKTKSAKTIITDPKKYHSGEFDGQHFNIMNMWWFNISISHQSTIMPV